MNKPINFEVIAISNRTEAKKIAEDEFKDRKEEFKDLSKKEIELFFDQGSDKFIRIAKKHSERVTPFYEHQIKEKDALREYRNKRYSSMFEKAAFVFEGERYTVVPQGVLCLLVGVSARHYRDVRTKYEESLNEDLIEKVFDGAGNDVDDDDDNEMASLKRVINELSLIGLSGVTEWSNNESTEAQKQAIEHAVEAAKVISDSELWQDCSIFKWYVSMSPDERVENGCKL